ncbi:MAG TPA: cell wall-binding repeat-containing protein, partial [Baekduia sp.]|nr:cell wall-binding repeat-containing protein [Baekduia sp.]
MRRPRTVLVFALAGALSFAACGRDDDPATDDRRPVIGVSKKEKEAAKDLGFPAFATKNTTRIGAADPVATAAAAARATFPGGSKKNTASAVAIASTKDWRAAVAASVLVASPVRAPVLLADGARELPPATQTAVDELDPSGAGQPGRTQAVLVGDVPKPAGLRTRELRGRTPFALARAVDAYVAAAKGRTSDRVLIVSADDPAFAMPAAGWAAKSGDPVLFVRKKEVPADTVAALRSHQQPKIYVLGPSKVIGPEVTDRLRKLGTVTRLGGQDPVENAVEFSRFADGSFGWGVQDAGHGLVFARSDRTLDAVAAAPLSA